MLGVFAHLGCTLNIDIEQEIDAGGQFVLHLTLEGTIEFVVDSGVFVKISGGNFGFEAVGIEKVVIDAVLFAAAWGAGGGGNHALYGRFFGQHAIADSGLAAAGGTGYDE